MDAYYSPPTYIARFESIGRGFYTVTFPDFTEHPVGGFIARGLDTCFWQAQELLDKLILETEVLPKRSNKALVRENFIEQDKGRKVNYFNIKSSLSSEALSVRDILLKK